MNNYDCGNMSYTTLRQAVKEAWESTTQADLDELLDSMHARCQAVINAQGMHIGY